MTKPIPAILVFVFYAPAFVLLALATKAIDIGVAYAVWSALGTALIAIIGIVYFHEDLTALKVAGLVLVIVGVVVLNLSGGH